MITKNQQINFLLSLVAAFLIDIFLFFFFQQRIVAFVGILFVVEALQEEQNWRILTPIVLVYLFECFIFFHPFGLPLLYVVPLIYACRNSRRIMHFSSIFYVCFFCILFLAENGAVYVASGNQMLSYFTIHVGLLCLNVALILGCTWARLL